MPSSVPIVSYFFAIFVCWFVYRRRQESSRRCGLSLPPGPKGLPVIGNLFDFPTKYQYLTLEKWHKQYGNIIHINLFGQSMIFLGSSEVTRALFEKRSAIYSDRPRFVMTNELMGWDFNLPSMRYGARWRQYRRVFHQQFHEGVIPRYRPVYERYTRRLLANILAEPDDVLLHVRHTLSAMILGAMYGIDVKDRRDPYVAIADNAMQGIIAARVPGAFLVESFPLLKYIPAWFPGATFQRKALHWKEWTEQLFHRPFEACKNDIREGIAAPSIAATILQHLPIDDAAQKREDVVKGVGATAYAAGSDTSTSTVQSFLLAMVMHPEVQKRAQAEIDAVVGCMTLPNLGDRSSLPYVNAVIKEVARWQPVIPLGIPHAAIQDDTFCGFFIPKGSYVMGNSWSILHDPLRYPDPDQFRPERFLTKNGKLDPDVQDPNVAVFGYGRRVCPGRHFSDASVYSIISALLATFTITPTVTEDGSPVKLKPEMEPGAIQRPVPFKCVIKPRSEVAKELIRRGFDE